MSDDFFDTAFSGYSFAEGFEMLWLAEDELGNVGGFVTAGSGPIPVASRSIDIYDLDDLVLDLLAVSEVTISDEMKVGKYFCDIAAKGIFVYDWTAGYGGTILPSDGYELVARPVSPIKITHLSPEFIMKSRIVKFAGADFTRDSKIIVANYVPCFQPKY